MLRQVDRLGNSIIQKVLTPQGTLVRYQIVRIEDGKTVHDASKITHFGTLADARHWADEAFAQDTLDLLAEAGITLVDTRIPRHDEKVEFAEMQRLAKAQLHADARLAA